MSLLVKVSQMLSSPLGSFAYYLLLFLALEAALGLALGERQSGRSVQIRRFLFVLSGLALLRLVYAVVAALTAMGRASPVAWLPPTERLIDTASLCLLGCLFASASKGEGRFWDLVFGAQLLLAVAAGVEFTFLWNKALAADAALAYDTTWQAIVWSAWQIALLALVGVKTLRHQAEGSVTFLAAILLISAGSVLQVGLRPAVANIATCVRLANLAAYPLITVAIYQSITTGMRAHAQQLQDISQASLDQIKSMILLFEASRQVSSSLNLPTVLDHAVRGLVRALDADECAIAFPEESDPGYLRLAAIYNAARPGRGEASTLPLEYQLTLRQAIRHKKYVIVNESDNLQLRVLFTLMGSSESGPLLVQPLLLDGEAFGLIIAGNSHSRRPFSAHDAKLCQFMAEQLVGAVQNARRYQSAQDRIKQLHRTLEEKRSAPPPTRAHARGVSEKTSGAQAPGEGPGVYEARAMPSFECVANPSEENAVSAT